MQECGLHEFANNILLGVTLKVCHTQYRPNDLRVTHAKTSPPDPRKPDHHRRFPE
jgi:hypothetical protein